MKEIPQVVRQRLAMAKAHPHPDADLLSAFAERRLRAQESERITAHLSMCRDCRAVVAFALPEIEETQAVRAAARSRGWLRFPMLRLGLSIACVAIVGTAVTLHYLPSGSPQTEKRWTATAMESDAPAHLSPKANQSEPMTGAAEASLQVAPKSGVPARTVKKAPVTTMALAMIPGRAKVAAEANATANGASSVPSGLAMAAPLAATDSGANAAPSSPSSLPNFLLSPRGTLSSAGRVQRSLEAGTRWETVRVAEKESFLAIAAFGQNVWLGGADGVLYHSGDAGQHWMQVKPVADGEVLSDDIIGVEFTDAQHGRLSTASGTWTTDDAGLSWQRF